MNCTHPGKTDRKPEWLGKLTSEAYWDRQWSRISLPATVSPDCLDSPSSAILRVFIENVPRSAVKTALEIGGAPGQFLAFVASYYECEVHSLDSSPVGCAKTEENFRLLGLDVTIHNTDLFQATGLKRFDFVYSLGFVEHFTNFPEVLRAHWDLVNPGGFLAVEVPHFVGVYWWLIERFAPSVAEKHNRELLDLNNWRAVEADLGLRPTLRRYIGLFDPLVVMGVLEEQLRYQPMVPPRGLPTLCGTLRALRRVRSGLYRRIPILWRLHNFCPQTLRPLGIALYRKPTEGSAVQFNNKAAGGVPAGALG